MPFLFEINKRNLFRARFDKKIQSQNRRKTAKTLKNRPEKGEKSWAKLVEIKKMRTFAVPF